MTDRVDHAAEARALLANADRYVTEDWPVQAGEHKADILAAAQVHATLALVEQQRIANLIALAGASDSIRARQQAEEVLYQPTPIQAGIDLPLTPDIAAALGIKAVDDE